MSGGPGRKQLEARVLTRNPEQISVGRAKALFMLAAGISFLLSVSLWFTGSREQGIFVGIWVPSILSAGALLLSRGGHE
jgi:hypothetical protein